jgi:AraC family transcriptional regulator
LVKLAAAVAEALADRARAGSPGVAAQRLLARGVDWTVHDVVCTCCPGDRPFEERHTGVAIALVVAGTFQYRIGRQRTLMTPGSLLLGNDGQCFECSHEHGAGDRCVSFRYSRDSFSSLAASVGLRHPDAPFDRSWLPALRRLSPVGAAVRSGLLAGGVARWDEIAADVAASVAGLLSGHRPVTPRATLASERRVTEVVRAIERRPAEAYPLDALARAVGLSPFHFLRTFQHVTGVSPHQYVMRARLREAAARLVDGSVKVLDVALDCGFGDASNFNHAFKREFGVSPRAFRLARGVAPSPARIDRID